MSTETPQPADVETDPRFPSGPWVGYFLQPPLRATMELQLTFRNSILKGEGRDMVGSFLVTGRYDLADGRCHWTKRYLGQHDVSYNGFNEGKGIWGTWEIPLCPDRGGFHIWPVGLAGAEDVKLSEELPLPISEELAPASTEAVPAEAAAP